MAIHQTVGVRPMMPSNLVLCILQKVYVSWVPGLTTSSGYR